jgi:folylpolyglutamate synthase/dihydropteroate synthase
MADKDVAGVVWALAASRALAGASVICTEVEEARALPAGELAALWSAAGFEPWAVRPPAAALDLALATASGPVVVAGSLYLVGAIRAVLIDDPLLRDMSGSG